ncbi:MAG TPA: AraC family transcriptional regulator [Chitinophagaceae bacterium]|nr:AraC family transcriptional regulator [Chitinophagaceae bacterium]
MNTLSPEIYTRIVSAKVFIDNHFEQPIHLEQISAKACLSKFHFHRLFKSVYKKTPHEYITARRLDKAKQLLQKEGISITDVCNLVGFESLGSFSLLFKKRHGFTPQYYRNIAYLKKKLVQEQPRHFVPHCYMETYHLEV